MQTKTETASNTILATTGTGLALSPAFYETPESPAFYETPEWMGAVAILGMVVLILTAINAAFSFKRNMKWNGKERRNSHR
jgi:hypothetical protein